MSTAPSSGRPIPHDPVPTDRPATGPVPREQRALRDIPLDREGLRLDINPFLREHQTHGLPVLTADQAAALRGAWREHFGRAAPLHVEIGSGNGFFLSGMAARYPDRSWLGVEIRYKRVMLTARKLELAGVVDHARIARYDGGALPDLFVLGEVDGVYLNHPDPWPRVRQAKNRMICGDWLDQVAQVLRPGGELQVKTDHRINVQALDAALPGRPFEVLGRSDDIQHHGAPWPDDVITNYQRKFYQKGLPVYALRLRRT